MQKKTFQHLEEQSDLGIKTYSDWPIWKHTIPFPSTALMGSSGTPELGRFLAVGSAWAQVVGHFMPINASILDIGCGCSKTARFLASDPRVKDYFAFDPMRDCIEWSNRYVKPYTEDRFLFEFVDLQSNEYNPYGTIKAESYRFPIETNSIDTVIAASVFTHLLEPATRQYLDQIGRVLKAGGCAIFSLHTEPAKDQNFSGNEGRVDVNLGYFLALAKSAGLSLLEDLGSLCGQEAIVLVKTRPVSPCL